MHMYLHKLILNIVFSCSSIHIFKDIKNIPKHPHTHEDSHMDTSQDEQNFFLSKKCFLTTLFVSKFKYKQWAAFFKSEASLNI